MSYDYGIALGSLVIPWVASNGNAVIYKNHDDIDSGKTFTVTGMVFIVVGYNVEKRRLHIVGAGLDFWTPNVYFQLLDE